MEVRGTENSLQVSESRDGLEELQRIQASHIIKAEKNGEECPNRRYPNDLRRTVAATGFKRFWVFQSKW